MDALTMPTDILGLGAVFARHHAQLKRAAQRIVGNAQSAEDLVHDAYLKAVEAAPEAHAVLQQPLSYAYRVVRNLAIDHHRREVLESRLFETDDSGDQVAAPRASTPDAVAGDRQALALVEKALAALPERVRSAFEMCRLEGRTQRDIGVQLGVSAATVNALVREALERCRAALHAG
jgi:RNA polymerase sigma factor (sigma-70 family)